MSKFEQAMTSLAEKIEKHLAPPLVKLGNQRHFAAIRAALIRTIPIIIVGSIPLILVNLPFETLSNFMAPYADALTLLQTMTFGFMGLFLTMSLGVEMAKMYDDLDDIMVSITTVASYLIVASPVNLAEGTLQISGLSAAGMFASFLVSIVVVEFMHLAYKYNITIRMPKQVPDNIANTFESLVPMAILVTFFWLIRIVLGIDIYSIINNLISPLVIVADTWYAAVVITLLMQALWFVGIHGGSFTIWGVMYPFLFANIAENAAAAAAGTVIPHIITEPFFYTYTMLGGVGMTLPLIFIWWKSKSATLREVSKVSLVPGIFCINEPVLFGVPIVLNPIMMIPFVFLTTVVGSLYGYIITSLGWVSPAIVQIPWSTPPLIQPYLSTGGDWRAVVAQLILIVYAFIVWYPFAKLFEKQQVAIENQESIENKEKR